MTQVSAVLVNSYSVPTDAPEADGALSPEGGSLRPDPDRPGLGAELKAEAERFAA